MKLPWTAYRVFKMQSVNDVFISERLFNRIDAHCPAVSLTYFQSRWLKPLFFLETPPKFVLPAGSLFVRIVLGRE